MKNYYLLALACVAGQAIYGMEEVKKNDWRPETYKQNIAHQQAGMYALSQMKFRGDERVLDIGYGGEMIPLEIAKKVPLGSVVAIGSSENLIKYSFNNNEQRNLTFMLCDLSKVETLNQLMKTFKATPQFRLITAFGSFSWMKNQKQAFSNIAYLLHKDGELIAGLAHEDSLYVKARLAMLTHDKWRHYFVGYEVPYYPSNEEKITALLEEAGLKSKEVRRHDQTQVFPTRQAFIQWMSAIPAQVDRIPECKQIEFLNDIVDEYLKTVPQKEDGSIEVIIGALGVCAGVNSES